MLFGGTFDPAYVMRVFALPTQLQPTTNKRNAALIQKHMEEAIGVPPSRGFLRFIPTLEEHTAWNGKTLAGEIDDLERNFGGFGGIEDSGSPQMPKRSKSRNRLSVRVSVCASKAEYGSGGLIHDLVNSLLGPSGHPRPSLCRHQNSLHRRAREIRAMELSSQ